MCCDNSKHYFQLQNCANFIITGIQIESALMKGFAVYDSNEVTFSNLIMDLFDTAIYLENCTDCVLTTNQFTEGMICNYVCYSSLLVFSN